MRNALSYVVLTVLFIGWRGEASLPLEQNRRVVFTQAAANAGIFGQVTVSAPAQRPPPSLSPYARRRYRPPQDPGEAGGTEDAVVYLEMIDGVRSPPAPAPSRIVQRNRTIMPYVSVVQTETTVEFPNEDDVFHNLFSLSSGNRFSLGRYGPGVTKTHRFETTGVVRLFCDIHAEMAGVILVLDTPYVVRAGPAGAYRLTDLPPAQYRAIAWHPDAGADTTLVDLRDGERRVDFHLSPDR